MNIGFDVLAFVSDSAAYMKECFSDGLKKGILLNVLRVTCWAHIVFLVGDEFCISLQLDDGSLASMKAIFSKAPGRRVRYLDRLRQNNAPKISLPKVHVITRQNTWFEVALYHAEHMDLYMSFVDPEMENGSTQQLHQLSTLLHGKQLNELQTELEFLVVRCERLIKMLKSLEAREFKAIDIYNTLSDMLSWLCNPEFP